MGSFPSRLVKKKLSKMSKKSAQPPNSKDTNLFELWHVSETISKDLTSNLNKLETYFKYLLSINNAVKIFQDPVCTEIFNYFKEFTFSHLLRQCLIQIDPCEKYKFNYILTDLLSYGLPFCLEYVRDPDAKNNAFQKSVFENVSALFDLTWYFAETSNKFHSSFIKANGIKVLISYASNFEFILQCVKYKSRFEMKRGKRFIVKSMMHSFHCVTRDTTTTRKDWERQDASGMLKKMNEIVGHLDPDLRILIMLTWANVISEEEIEKSDFSKDHLPEVMIENLNKVVHAIITKENLFRIQIYQEDSSIKEAAVVIVDRENHNYEYTVVDLSEAMYRLSINDKVKRKMYNEVNMKQILKDVIIYGNNFEREHATKLLWQLCFDSVIMEDVMRDQELFEFMKDLCLKLKNDPQSETLVKNLTGILWMKNGISGKKMGRRRRSHYDLLCKKPNNFRHVVEAISSQASFDHDGPNAQSDSSSETDKHIMISYNSDSRELCLRIKKELERLGHSVWIDVEAISGSSLESMANAVENAKCVFICMTEKYKQSTNCRAEAEYSFNLKKPIVPLIMQPNYVPDGWLGIILGSKIYVDFTKYSFDECIRKMKFEIDCLVGEKTTINETKVIKADTNGTKNGGTEAKEVEKWTNKEVKSWLKEKKFNAELAKALESFDGALLSQLNNIYKTSPPFLYQMLTKHSDVSLYDKTRFLFEFEKLFF